MDPWLNLLPDQMSEQSEPLVGGQGEDRLMEGPFVVLAQIRPIHSGYNIVINVVHYIEIVTSQLYLANRFKGKPGFLLYIMYMNSSG